MKDIVCTLNVSHPNNRHSPRGISDTAFARHTIASGVNALLQRWPVSLSATFRRYRMHSIGPSTGTPLLPAGELPYWLHQPVWLMCRYANEPLLQHERTFLEDVILGQYFVFLSFRITDDLFDEQTREHSLVHAAQRFRREARTIFSRYFGKTSTFWGIYRTCLATTARHIRLVDKLQHSPDTDPNDLLRAYAGVNAIFTIGPAAVCVRYRRIADYRLMRAFSDRCSTGTQVLDDMADIREDLRRRRWNYAANVAYRSVASGNRARHVATERIAKAFRSGDVPIKLLDQVKSMVESAFEMIQPLHLESAKRCRRDYRRSLSGMKGAVRALTALSDAGSLEIDRINNSR